jgi:hypothetical protein
MLYLLLKIRHYTKAMKNPALSTEEFFSYADRKLAVKSVYLYTKNLYKEEGK